MPVTTHTGVHSTAPYIQHQGYDNLITHQQGTGYKGNLTAYVQGCDETAGPDQLYQHGSTPSKASLTSSPVPAEGKLQVSSQSLHTIKFTQEQ